MTGELRWLWATRLLLVLGLVLSGYLAVAGLQLTSLAGCGGSTPLGASAADATEWELAENDGRKPGGADSSTVAAGWDCRSVLSSRWSTWLGLPVGIPALSVYATALVFSGFAGPSVPARLRQLSGLMLAAAGVLLAGSAVWFIGLQLLAVERWCGYCLALHSISLLSGLTVARWIILSGVLTARTAVLAFAFGCVPLAALTLGQWLVAPPPSYELERFTGDEPLEPYLVSDRLAGPPRLEALPDALVAGWIRFDRTQHPRIGGGDSDKLLIKLVDYTCGHCRSLTRELHELRRASPEWTILVMPVPLHPDCNPEVPELQPQHAEACELARLALAVWLADPDAFADFDAWLFADERPRTAAEARAEATRLVGSLPLATALNDPRIDSRLALYTDLFAYLGSGVLPKLLLPQAIRHG